MVFSHGSFMDNTMFDPQLDHFAARGWHCVSYNSRALTHPDEIHTLADLADQCIAVADAYVPGPFVLCGMSVGAFMAIELALSRPERIAAMILIDGKAAAYSDDESTALAPIFAPLDTDGPMPADFANWLAPMCFGATTCAENPALVARWIERWTTRIPARSAHRQYRSWIDKADRRPDLGRIAIPTLILHGAEDIPTPLAHSEAMAAAMPNASLVVVPRAGHTSNLEQSDFVNTQIEQFLDRAVLAGRSNA